MKERRLADERSRSALADFGRAAIAMTEAHTPADVLSALAAATKSILGVSATAIAFLGGDGTSVAAWLTDGIETPALRRLRDPSAHPVAGLTAGSGAVVVGEVLGVPIVYGDRTLGTLYATGKRDHGGFSTSDTGMATALAAQAAVSLENVRVRAHDAELARRLDIAIADLEQHHDTAAEFIASVSHELRAPLHSILVAAELVHDPVFGPLTAENRRRLGETIQVSGHHLLRLVDDLVDLSRVDLHRLELGLNEVSIGQMLDEVREIAGPVAAAKGVGLDVPITLGATITADPMRLRQVLVNLVENAVRFTDAGGHVRVYVETRPKGISISVHDDGIGIAPEDLERIFEPFEQVSASRSGGSGLGLAIAKRLVGLHGGRLEVCSTLGVGTTFTVLLDAAVAPHPMRRPRRHRFPFGQPVPAVEPVPAGRSILLVENEPTEVELVGGLLKRIGYEVHVVSDITEAGDRIAEVMPSLVLLDVRLGTEEGLDLSRQVRLRHNLDEVPILALTTDATPAAIERALAAGCNASLTKPVGARELLATIQGLLAEPADVEDAHGELPHG